MAWDTTSTHSLAAFAEYQRKQVDGLIVVIIRAKDAVLAVDETIHVLDVHDRLWEKDVPALLESLVRARDEKRDAQLKREERQRRGPAASGKGKSDGR